MENRDLIEQIELLIETGEYQTALVLCDEAIQLFPSDPIFLCLKGITYQQLGEFSMALYFHTKSVSLEPNYFISWSCISIIHLEMMEMEKAHHSILRALRTGPENAESWWLRAIFRELQGDLTGGERAYKHANWLNPKLVPPLPVVEDHEILDLLLEGCLKNKVDTNALEKHIDIRFEPVPDVLLMKESDIWESPIHILFSFQQEDKRASIICYRQNLRRAIAEQEDIVGYIDSLIIPRLEEYLQRLVLD